jgi:acyl carrier protein
MRSQIVDIICRAIAMENELRTVPIDLSKGEATALYGPQGHLDSLGLVSVIVEVEQLLSQQLGMSVVLVSDRAMSARNSPFATVGSFADYIVNSSEACRV